MARPVRRLGMGGRGLLGHAAPGIRSGALRPLRELRPAADEVVVLHYSGYARGLESLLERATQPADLAQRHPGELFLGPRPARGRRAASSSLGSSPSWQG